MTTTRRLTVVGRGVIGLSCAWQLAKTGRFELTVVAPDPLPHTAASYVAAGMLAPVTEAQFGEAALTALNLDSAIRWKEFATTLEDDAGLDIGYDESGTLTVALDTSDRATLDDLLAYQHTLGLTAHRRSASACRALVPGLAPTIRGGIEVPGDHHVDNRALLHALTTACTRAGVTFVDDVVVALEAGPELLLGSGHRISSSHILLAAGTGITDIKGLEGAGIPDIRPVKGTILRLGPAPACPTKSFLPITVRGLVRGQAIYLVPRVDGSVVVGATLEERGDVDLAHAGSVHQLLDDARTIVPAIDELPLLETGIGLRPTTASHQPHIGWTRLPDVAVATGHFRHGFLLAPITADAVCALFEDEPLPTAFEALARDTAN